MLRFCYTILVDITLKVPGGVMVNSHWISYWSSVILTLQVLLCLLFFLYSELFRRTILLNGLIVTLLKFIFWYVIGSSYLFLFIGDWYGREIWPNIVFLSIYFTAVLVLFLVFFVREKRTWIFISYEGDVKKNLLRAFLNNGIRAELHWKETKKKKTILLPDLQDSVTILSQFECHSQNRKNRKILAKVCKQVQNESTFPQSKRSPLKSIVFSVLFVGLLLILYWLMYMTW